MTTLSQEEGQSVRYLARRIAGSDHADGTWIMNTLRDHVLPNSRKDTRSSPDSMVPRRIRISRSQRVSARKTRGACEDAQNDPNLPRPSFPPANDTFFSQPRPGWIREHAQAGDIVFGGAQINWSGTRYNHCALVVDPANELLVEAVPEDGVSTVSWQKVSHRYDKIALARVKGLSLQQGRAQQ
jgi:hypothetical protein